MADSDGISATAGPSGADSSPPASCTAEPLADASATRDRGSQRPNPRVDFYVLGDTASSARLKLACRLAEKAYLASQRALIWHTDRAELQALDELLWTFAEGSFVPHEWLTSNSDAGDSDTHAFESEYPGKPPVLLSAGWPVPLAVPGGGARFPAPSPPSERVSESPEAVSGRSLLRNSPGAELDFVVNLASEPPPFLHLTRRVAEIVDADEARRRAARARFKAYRALGIEPATHTLRAE
ncbi:MAG: DNA polymerase III subunit chi [Steroidobacteraceae bacterium]